MTSELQIMDELRRRLLIYGYPNSSIQAEVKTAYGRRVDVVIYELNKPKVAIELKPGFTLDEPVDPVDLIFNPIVRQAQLQASDLNAPYFAIFNGIDIFWFDIDVKNGRPELLNEPIKASSNTKEYISEKDSRITFSRLLYTLYDLMRSNYDSPKILVFLGIILLAKLQEERGNPNLKHSLQGHGKLVSDQQIASLNSLVALFDSKSDDYFSRAFSILESFRLSTIPPSVFIEAIDELLLNIPVKVGVFKLPFWLSDVLTTLCQVRESDFILDIYSNFGDGLAFFAQSLKEVNVFSMTSSEHSYLWEILKRSILQQPVSNLTLVQFPNGFSGQLEKIGHYFDIVLMTAPFNARIRLNSSTINSEQYFLQTAITRLKNKSRIVALLPENFLFSESNQKYRAEVLNKLSIRAVISLEQFLPGTSVKASIVVLDKRSEINIRPPVAMMQISNKQVEEAKNQNGSIRELKPFKELLNVLSDQTTKYRDTEQLWFVSQDVLTNKSWSVTSNLPREQIQLNALFPIRQIGEVAHLRKGSPLTLDPEGDLLVIGPASVRTLDIDISQFDRTTEERLTKQPVVAQEGDVLIHAVGPNRGQAAVVGESLKGLHISRNIIVTRPDPNVLLPQYFAIALSSSFVQQQFEQKTGGSVIRQLSIRALQEVFVPVPNFDMQQKIILQVENARQSLIQIEQKLIAAESELKEEKLNFQSIIDSFHVKEVINE